MKINTFVIFGGKIYIRYIDYVPLRSSLGLKTRFETSVQVHSGYQELASQPFCDLCEKLNSNLPPKIYR